MASPALSNVLAVLFGAAIVGTLALNTLKQNGNFSEPVDPVADIRRKVADDYEAQFRAVQAHGTQTDLCVHAGIAAEANLQAHDEVGYARWKAEQRAQCAAAGVTQ